MPIRPDQIDPTIQNALQARLAQVFAAPVNVDPVMARVQSAGKQRWRETARQFAGNFWAGGAGILSGLFSLPVVAATNEGLGVVLFFLLSVGGFVLIIRGLVQTQQELTRYVSADLMRGAHHLIALSRAEQLYCNAVAALIEAGPAVGDPVQAELLGQLNGLLESHRKLDRPAQQFQSASGSDSIEALVGELAELTRRRDALTDPSAQGMMDQSVALCARRLEGARALLPAREQAVAQQELILQTLASVQASLARTGTAPALTGGGQVEELQHSVAQMNRQARAVEEAVAEVVALNA